MSMHAYSASSSVNFEVLADSFNKQEKSLSTYYRVDLMESHLENKHKQSQRVQAIFDKKLICSFFICV